MQDNFTFKRRQFLKMAAGLGALGFNGFWSEPVFSAPTDYKALVCINLAGGNDGNNVIVPRDPTRFAAYKAIRGGYVALLPDTELLPPIMDSTGNPYSLHASMPEMNQLYLDGRLAMVLNTGGLSQPITRSQFLAGQGKPPGLYSHSDQTIQAQSGHPNVYSLGWGGRLLESMGETGNFAAVSVTHPALFLQGQTLVGNTFSPGSSLSVAGLAITPLTASAARRQSMETILKLDGGHPLRAAANRIFLDGMRLADNLQSLDNSLPALATTFPVTAIGIQLKEVTRQIRIRSKMGPGRQVFYCSLGGFDTHSAQKSAQKPLLAQLSQAMAAFYNATVEVGLTNQVTTFTQSEFGRTLLPSGTGSNHGWGNHHFIVGGGVKGGIYGNLPQFVLGGPDDAHSYGAWIPKIATLQFGATLGRWFGVADSDLLGVFPGLDKFPSNNVGFMLSQY